MEILLFGKWEICRLLFGDLTYLSDLFLEKQWKLIVSEHRL